MTTKIWQAAQQVMTHRRRSPTISTDELRALAESVAVRLELDYLNGEVEPTIVGAILAMSTPVSGDPNQTESVRAEAIRAAWKLYDANWDHKILH